MEKNKIIITKRKITVFILYIDLNKLKQILTSQFKVKLKKKTDKQIVIDA